jgi:phage gpG-like protein
MISVEIDTTKAIAMIDGISKNLSPESFRRYISNKVSPYVREQAEETFDGEGGRIGGWEPLKPSTWERKKTARMLVETGKLKKEVTSVRENFDGPYSAYWGAKSQVYKSHQTGFRHYRSKKEVPARPMLKWNNQDADFLRASLEYHIMRGL